MRPGLFLKDKCLLLLLHLVCMCGLWVYLRLTGYGRTYIVLVLAIWVLVLAIWLSASYFQRRRFFREAAQILEKMDRRYLLGELLPKSFQLEDILYREMICKSNKSVIERIHSLEEEQQAYREYMENWVHEIKAPIANISLLCENRRKHLPEVLAGDEAETGMKAQTDGGAGWREAPAGNGGRDYRADFTTISLENGKIENCVDMVLYYARSEEVYKDYLIREVELGEVVREVLDRNRLALMAAHVRVEVDCGEHVCTDRKWVAFILNQLLLNSVKYAGTEPLFQIGARRGEGGVLLTFADNGVGICQEELPRIFEKGFTGSNGRNHDRSTGMGLYLCRKLCDKLGIGIRVRSRYGQGTQVILEFPVNRYITAMDK